MTTHEFFIDQDCIAQAVDKFYSIRLDKYFGNVPGEFRLTIRTPDDTFETIVALIAPQLTLTFNGHFVEDEDTYNFFIASDMYSDEPFSFNSCGEFELTIERVRNIF